MAYFINVLVYVLIFISTVVSILYNLLTKYYNYWKDRNVPHERPILFWGTNKEQLIGDVNIGDMARKHYTAWPNERLVGSFQSRWPELIIRDPELIKQVLIKDFHHFYFREKPFNEEVEPLLRNLFHMNNDDWKPLRNKLSPIFSSGKLKNMFRIMVDRSDEFEVALNSLLKENNTYNIRDLCAKYTTDVIGSCAFGIQTAALKQENAPFRQIGRVIFETGYGKTIRMLLRVVFPTMANFLKVRLFRVEVQQFMFKMIGEILRQRKNNVTGNRDFIDFLIELRDSGPISGNLVGKRNENSELVDIQITDDIVVALAFGLFAAGFETSSTTMSFALYELALNSDVQDRAYKEIMEVLQKNGGKITYEGILEMKYLDKIIQEALRKYPPLPVLTRECTSPCTLDGTDVQVDTNCTMIIPVLAIHRDPKYYPNPEKFDPERFSAEAISERHPYVYLPFGDGPRICPGARFGKVQSMVGMVTILKKYRVEKCERTPTKFVQEPSSYVMVHKGNIWLKLTER